MDGSIVAIGMLFAMLLYPWIVALGTTGAKYEVWWKDQFDKWQYIDGSDGKPAKFTRRGAVKYVIKRASRTVYNPQWKITRNEETVLVVSRTGKF